MTFGAPWFLLGLVFIPIVLWLHFIRQAKRVREVSALWLWSSEEAPERRARFNPNILLLLQILTILCATLGAAGLRFVGDTREQVFIFDSSAAMTATDVAPNRLESAKVLARDQLGGRVTLIRAGLSATILSSAEDSPQQRQNALERLAAGDSGAALESALALAQSIAPQAEVTVYSSAAPVDKFRGTWQRILGDGVNIGIAAFAIRGTQVFAALESNQNTPVNAEIKLTKDDKPVAQTTLKIPAGGSVTWTPKIKLEAGTYKLELPKTDALMLDNQAYAALLSSRVLVSPPQDDVLRALVSVPGIRTAARDTPPNTARGYDAMVLVGAVPKALPEGNYIIFAPLPNKNQIPKLERITRADSTDSLLRFVALEGVRVRRSSLAPPELPEGGAWTPLAYVGSQPFIWRGVGANVRAVYIAAHPLESELRKFPAFPVLLFNILQEYASAKAVPLGSKLGTSVTFQGNIADGFGRALLPGVYTSDGERLVANLSSSSQTRLVAGASETLKLGEARATQNTAPISDFSPWRLPLLLLALVALLLEAALRGGGFGALFSRVRGGVA
jgi:Ca-activated chloride channel homolog